MELGGGVPKYFPLLSAPAIKHTVSPLLYTVAGLAQRLRMQQDTFILIDPFFREIVFMKVQFTFFFLAFQSNCCTFYPASS